MIHDLLLSLLTPSGNVSLIHELSNSTIATSFLHPVEINTISEINKISNQYKDIKQFSLKYGINRLEVNEDDLQNGLYLQAFADGLGQVIQCYQDTVIDLEKKFLQKDTFTLMFLFKRLEKYKRIFDFLQGLINGVKTQKLHGCSILQYLQQNVLHGNYEIVEAVLVIQKQVYVVFIQQLCQWLLYGKFVDNYHEFFIQHAETLRVLNSSEKVPGSTPTIQTTATTLHSSETSINTDWHFEIAFDLLPYHFPKRWAEKVLFVGQTVLMFNSDPREETKHKMYESEAHRTKHSIWGEQEHIYFKKFHELLQKDKLTVVKFEQVVDEIKVCVTEHLSRIAIHEADLVKQLKLIKDFYLLGRGELFYEFIKAIKPIYAKTVNEGIVRDINRSFQSAAASVNVSDDVELFSFHLLKDEIESHRYNAKGFLNHIAFKYKVKWPLHLLFSPKILEQYNELFRFLLRIKKSQYDLHMVWCYHREIKDQRNPDLLQFRNKLMFLTDNLQYYLQVDVLESQFCILMGKVKEEKDFEHIQRAHSVFLADVLALCFLLDNTDPSKSGSPQQITENPVLSILNKILHLVDQFTSFAHTCTNPMSEIDQQQFKNFEVLFASFVESLLKMLTGLKAGPSTAPLAQLLLRLDFNYWFSSQNK